MASETITDPLLGEDGRVFGSAERAWASFKRVFAPSGSEVSVLVNVVQGEVPQHQRDLYREVEAWYPTGVREVYESVRRAVEKDTVLMKWLPPDDLPSQLQLTTLNIRYPFSPPAKCILQYRFDPNMPVWFVRIGEDFHVEWCGLGD